MNEIDIFSIGEPSMGQFFYFKEIGDAIKGTYIGSREAIDNYNNEQIIYMLKDSDGAVWNVGVRKSNAFLIEEMQAKELGDIIGIRYDEDKDSKKYPGKVAKIIRVYPHKTRGPVDTAWLNERNANIEKLKQLNGELSGQSTPTQAAPVFVVDEIFGEKPVSSGIASMEQPKPVENDAFEAIRNLAVAKGLITADLDKASANKKIEEFTGVALSEDKFSEIIIKLTGFTK